MIYWFQFANFQRVLSSMVNYISQNRNSLLMGLLAQGSLVFVDAATN